MKLPTMDELSEYVSQYYTDNNIKLPSNVIIDDNWLINEYIKISNFEIQKYIKSEKIL